MDAKDVIEKLNSAIILNRMNIVTLMQTLVEKGVVTREEMQDIRNNVMRHPRYQELMENVQDLESLMMNDPEEVRRLSAEINATDVKA